MIRARGQEADSFVFPPSRMRKCRPRTQVVFLFGKPIVVARCFLAANLVDHLLLFNKLNIFTPPLGSDTVFSPPSFERSKKQSRINKKPTISVSGFLSDVAKMRCAPKRKLPNR